MRTCCSVITLAVVLGFGSAVFAQIELDQLPSSSSTGQPISLILEDVDGDGVLDFVAAPRQVAYLVVRLGVGDGSFLDPTLIPIGSTGSRLLRSGDFNLDGVADVVVSRDTQGAEVLLGDGAGGFDSELVLSAGTFSIGASVADFNADGFADVVCFDTATDTVRVFLGDGAGGFSTVSPVGFGDGLYLGCAGDFNSDGFADLAVSTYESLTIKILHGVGDGTFVIGQALTTHADEWIEPGDLDGDGHLDIVALNQETFGVASSIVVFLGSEAGLFTFHAEYLVGNLAKRISIVDIDGDGNRDVLVTNTASESVTLLQGQGDGGLVFGDTIFGVDTPYDVAAGDLDDDGDPDLVINGLYGQIGIYENISLPRFTRGDCNLDELVDVGDVITVLAHIMGDQPVTCLDACDGNDDGLVDVADGVTLAHSLFVVPSIPLPGLSGCATDWMTVDSLGCAASACP